MGSNVIVKVIATTHENHISKKQDFDTFGGHAAGVCYMQSTFDEICGENSEKTSNRIKLTKENLHHSVYDHSNISLYLHNIPRVIECILDNERMMTSSVKSGRYTRHILQPKEAELYDKWIEIFKPLIKNKYQEKSPKFFTDSRIEKLAMENARYLTSAFTPISMIHTLSYRQLNYIYGFIRSFVAKQSNNDFINKLKPYLIDFLSQLDMTGYIDKDLTETGKKRNLSLFNNRVAEECFGDVYSTNYSGSFAYFLHANRHRTLKYWIAEPSAPDKLEYYTPEILNGHNELCALWRKDLESLNENYPQAMLLNITELGNIDDFVLKLFERKCSVVMLETMHRTNAILDKYVKKRPELEKFTKGSRCTFDGFKCISSCNFADGITEKRMI